MAGASDPPNLGAAVAGKLFRAGPGIAIGLGDHPGLEAADGAEGFDGTPPYFPPPINPPGKDEVGLPYLLRPPFVRNGGPPGECPNGIDVPPCPEIISADDPGTMVMVSSVGVDPGLIEGLRRLPEQITEILEGEDRLAEAAKSLAQAENLFFVGRVRGYPVAREGAQKFKEISYRHAEAYQTSELKHGPLALISPTLPTVAVVPEDELTDRNVAAMHEISARGGPLFVVTHATVDLGDLPATRIDVPKNEPELDPILLTIPMQLLAYHAALELGLDIDKPRNLAKSVTVE